MFVCLCLALKGTSLHINPSVVVGPSSNSNVTQSFTLVPLNLPREKGGGESREATQLQFNERLRKQVDTQCDIGRDLFEED